MAAEIFVSIGPMLTGVAALYAAVKAHKAEKNTNGVEGKSAAQLAREARDAGNKACDLIELHNADTQRHLY